MFSHNVAHFLTRWLKLLSFLQVYTKFPVLSIHLNFPLSMKLRDHLDKTCLYHTQITGLFSAVTLQSIGRLFQVFFKRKEMKWLIRCCRRERMAQLASVWHSWQRFCLQIQRSWVWAPAWPHNFRGDWSRIISTSIIPFRCFKKDMRKYVH